MCSKQKKRIPVYEFAFQSICMDVRTYTDEETVEQLDTIWTEAFAKGKCDEILGGSSPSSMCCQTKKYNALIVTA